jgi:hypothetical protein
MLTYFDILCQVNHSSLSNYIKKHQVANDIFLLLRLLKMSLKILTPFFYIFGLMLGALIVAKIGLTFYRMAARVWPPSARFLWRIIDWRVEAAKILVLAFLSLLFSLLWFLIR